VLHKGQEVKLKLKKYFSVGEVAKTVQQRKRCGIMTVLD